MHRGTSRNILKEKKCCFVCLKARHISKNYLSKMNYYNCSKQHHVAICHFDKTDSNTQDSENNTTSNNDSTKEETNVSFSSPNYSGQRYLRGIYLRVVLNLRISPQV